MQEQPIDHLRKYLPDYLRRQRGLTNLRRNFQCLSPNHEDRHPSMHYYPDHEVVICFACGYKADIFRLYAQDHGLDEKKDFPQIIRELTQKFEPVAVASCPKSYLETRGLTAQTIEFFGVTEHAHYHMDGRKLGPCITIPYGNQTDYVIVRETGQKRFWKPAGQEEPVFHEEFLEETQPVVLVESAICAMSVYQAGYPAIALNGTGDSKLKEKIDALKRVPPFLLCFDQDDAGEKVTARFVEFLEERHLPFVAMQDLDGCKDPNELLQKNPQKLTALLDQAAAQLKKPAGSMMDYIKNDYLNDLNRKENLLSTGFPKWDKMIGGVSEELYVLGGIPSCGKTSLFLQLACNFAEQGRKVLFFSYEAAQKNLLEKCLSHYSLREESEVSFSPQDISDLKPEELIHSIRLFSETAKNIRVIDDSPNIDRVESIIKAAVDEHPIVIFDYLQIIPYASSSSKEKVDGLVERLVSLRKKYHLTMFVISSLNRSSYLSPISLDSYKESGGIEFSADQCYALQYQILSTDPVFLQDLRLGEKRKKLEQEKQAPVRKLELVCLKSRFGAAPFSVPLNFETEYSNFR